MSCMVDSLGFAGLEALRVVLFFYMFPGCCWLPFRCECVCVPISVLVLSGDGFPGVYFYLLSIESSPRDGRRLACGRHIKIGKGVSAPISFCLALLSCTWANL